MIKIKEKKTKAARKTIVSGYIDQHTLNRFVKLIGGKTTVSDAVAQLITAYVEKMEKSISHKY